MLREDLERERRDVGAPPELDRNQADEEYCDKAGAHKQRSASWHMPAARAEPSWRR